jgi:hypothetical protein
MMNAKAGEMWIRLIRRWDAIAAILIVLAATVTKIVSASMPAHAVMPPSPPMPAVNARDYYDAASARLVEPDRIRLMVGDVSPSAGRGIAVDLIASPGDRERLANENAPAIATLRQGMPYAFEYPALRSYPLNLRDLKGDHDLADLLELDSRVRSNKGDYAGAMRDCLDCMRLAYDLPHGGDLDIMPTSELCDRIGRLAATDLVDRLNAGNARADAKRLEKIDSSAVPTWQSLQYTEWEMQGALLNLFRQPHWRETFLDMSDDDGLGFHATNSTEAYPVSYAQLSTRERTARAYAAEFVLNCESASAAYGNCTRYMDQAIAREKLPWPARRNVSEPKAPNDPISQALLQVYDRATFEQCLAFALDRLLDTRLALRAYRLDHGRYPDSVAQLAPAYLSRVPLDPFTGGAPLKYRPSGAGYVLYSIGPDAVDDGGTPIDFSYDLSNETYSEAIEHAKGDIVAEAVD